MVVNMWITMTTMATITTYTVEQYVHNSDLEATLDRN